MSESYLPNHTDSNANGTKLDGYPGMPRQRPFDHGPTPGQPTSPEYPASGYAGPSSYGPVPPPTGSNSTALLPRRVLAALVVAAVMVLVLGGFSFVTHGKLQDAETKGNGLTRSLDTANKSVAAKQSEVQSKEKELETARQESQQVSAVAQVALACATQLDDAWNLFFNDAEAEQVMAALEASRGACDQLDASQSPN